jgi:Tfp pilus assembly protein PilO
MAKLSKRNQRALIILAAVVTLTVAFSYVVLPFLDAKDRIKAEIQNQQRELSLSVRTLREEGDYIAELASIDRLIQQYEAAFLDASDAGSATVQLEEAVRAFADQHGIRVTRSNPMPELKIGEQYIKISLQLNLEGDLTALTNFLHSIASYDKFLTVEEFNLASFRVREMTRIRPRMRIAGYVRLS